MNIDWERIVAFAILGAALSFGAVVIFAIFHVFRSILRWMLGKEKPEKRIPETKPQPRVQEGGTSPVSASDLYAIRANIDVIVRQLENLERRVSKAAPVRPGKAEQDKVRTTASADA